MDTSTWDGLEKALSALENVLDTFSSGRLKRAGYDTEIVRVGDRVTVKSGDLVVTVGRKARLKQGKGGDYVEWQHTTRLPAEEPEEPSALKCPKCGRLVKKEPVRTEAWEDTDIGPDGEEYVVAGGIRPVYGCTRCGEVVDPSPVYRW